MMNKLYLYGIALLVSALPSLASAATYDGSSKFVCASVEIMECLPGDGCQKVNASDVDIPRFFKVDLKKKTIITGSETDKRKSAIKQVGNVDGKLILQGAEDGQEDRAGDGAGWTMAVNKERGDMVLTTSGDGVAFVVFGACTSM